MAVAASGQGGALVRVDPERSEDLVATTDARLMEMRGRTMQGWLRIDSEHLRTKRQLAKWVELGVGYARSLPAKLYKNWFSPPKITRRRRGRLPQALLQGQQSG